MTIAVDLGCKATKQTNKITIGLHMCSGSSKESYYRDGSFEYPQLVSLRKEKLES